MNKSIQVQVICVTFNHEKYIRKALDSFIAQKCNFLFEVLIGDDCSTDRTLTIVREYAKHYPSIIKIIPRSKNLGPIHNLFDLIKHCSAPYIAFCDGDDYWIDNLKLQKQFDYMEKHKSVNFCFTRTKIEFQKNSQNFLKNWYKEINGEVILPDSHPDFKFKKIYNTGDKVNLFCAHTSSYFFRWNYSVDFPKWIYNGYTGDYVILYIQMGDGKASMLPDVTSVYRKSDVGVTNGNNLNNLLLNTRFERIRVFWELINWGRKNFNNDENKICMAQLSKRLCSDILILMNLCKKKNNYDEFFKVVKSYPAALCFCFEQFNKCLDRSNVSFFNKVVEHKNFFLNKKKNMLKSILNKLQKTGRKFGNLVLSYLFFDENWYLKKNLDVAKSCIDPWKHFKKYGWKEGRKGFERRDTYLRMFLTVFLYWAGCLIPKNKKIWVFSSFFSRGYMDNTKYLYEYILDHHPELNVFWITRDNGVYSKLIKEKKPVLKMSSWYGRWITLRAKIAIVDHFISSDFSIESGFNAGTKVLQLWHGVGLKSMQPVNGVWIPNTTIPGVRLSPDLFYSFINKNKRQVKVKNKIKYFFNAPFRECFEKYFGFVCPGKEHIKFLANVWNIPNSSIIRSGLPRNIFIHTYEYASKSDVSIIYAPTYRWDARDEEKMIDSFLNAIPIIHHFLEKFNCTLTLRLHPHTWRNYDKKINNKIKPYSRICVDKEKDIYKSLFQYNIMIADYSSIAYDFVLMNRPVVFYIPDYDTFLKHDVKFNYSFNDFTPGPKTTTWENTIVELVHYMKDPTRDAEWRKKVRDELYDMDINDCRNSERIVNEVEYRLNIKKN